MSSSPETQPIIEPNASQHQGEPQRLHSPVKLLLCLVVLLLALLIFGALDG
jgi:hypothetical protein